MSNETKREVFEKLAECYAEVYDAYTDETGSPYYCDDEPNYLDDYDAALPDDLPVIPETVGAFIKRQKAVEENLATLFYDACCFDEKRGNGRSMFQDTDNLLWAYDNQNTFSRAWVLGVWRVEETGEIVKLEEEK